MNTIRILTYQSKEVYENLQNGNIHIARMENYFSKITPITFNYALSLINDNLPGNDVVSPVFAWYRVDGEIVGDNIKSIKEFVVGANEKTGVGYGCVVMILEVPRDELIFTSFYDYTDCLYVEEFEYDKNDPDDEIDFRYIQLDNEDDDTLDIQILMKYIKPDWIVDVFNRKEFDLADY